LAIQPSREHWRSDQPDLADLLQTLAQNTKVQAERVISGPDIALQVHLQGLLQDHAPNSSLDFCSAAIWLDRVETVSQALAEVGSDTMRHQSRELISDFRSKVLGYSRQTPSTFEKLLPKPWYQHDLERFSKELATCLGLDPLSDNP
jgi:hypothetical protein